MGVTELLARLEPKLVKDWRQVVRKALSFRLCLIATALQIIGFILTTHSGFVPREMAAMVFGVLGIVFTAGASIARVVHQSNME